MIDAGFHWSIVVAVILTSAGVRNAGGQTTTGAFGQFATSFHSGRDATTSLVGLREEPVDEMDHS
jgi:hypothetical protein